MLSQGVAASVVYRAPLTARFESLPTGHDGTTPFAVQLAFSEPIWLTEAVMRTQALTVTGGRVTSARRVNGRSDRWEITIQPDANDVRIALPPTTSCNTNGAVCTQDGHALSNGLSATVTGPAAKSVAALQTFALYANYPNPFNAETQMTYALPVAGAVELAIYNVRGQRGAHLSPRRAGGGALPDRLGWPQRHRGGLGQRGVSVSARQHAGGTGAAAVANKIEKERRSLRRLGVILHRAVQATDLADYGRGVAQKAVQRRGRKH